MLAYSLLLLLALTLSAPWWLTRMLTTQRYREGLSQRLGRVPPALREYARGHRIVWLHAVSVGEVLAATRLVAELESALREKDDSFRIVISTTTRTGQELARQRFGAERVFYYPLDLAFAVRAYLEALKPEALVLMESELWPRMLAECSRRRIPVSVVNARVSDRSYARAQRFRAIWSRLLAKVTLFLAQSEEDAQRLVSLGARRDGVRTSGNLKYDVRAAQATPLLARLREILGERKLVIAGSTLEGEEQLILDAWAAVANEAQHTQLLVAPRHPERFDAVEALLMASGHAVVRASKLHDNGCASQAAKPSTILLLDTIGDLAGVYSLAHFAFVGGSLVPRGGHNPLEPAQFNVAVVMGSSFENFRDIVARMQAAHAIRIVQNASELESAFRDLLAGNDGSTFAMGWRGRHVFQEQSGATARTVDVLLELISGGPR